MSGSAAAAGVAEKPEGWTPLATEISTSVPCEARGEKPNGHHNAPWSGLNDLAGTDPAAPAGAAEQREVAHLDASAGWEAAKGAGCLPSEQECRSEFAQWLSSLDPNRGAVLQYLEPLAAHFDSVEQFASALQPVRPGVSKVKGVDEQIWEALGVARLGHRLLLVQGMATFAERLGGPR